MISRRTCSTINFPMKKSIVGASSSSSSPLLFFQMKWCSTSSSSNDKNNSNNTPSQENDDSSQQNTINNNKKTQKATSSVKSSNNNNNNQKSSSSSSSSSFQIPAGLEVYAGCVFVVAGWWYWNEASYRRVDRACEGVEGQAKEKAKQLTSVVNSTETRWHEDVRGKEAMLAKVHLENVRLAKLLDDVTNYLKKCNVPLV